MASSKHSITGAAGEYYVMSQLLRHGFIAALAPQGVPNIDIIITDIEGSHLCSIQVKTRANEGSGWQMKAKHEEIKSDSLFYCFVDFGADKNQHPKTYVIPSKTVAQLIRKDHQQWLATPGKNGRKRNDSNLRRLKTDHTDTIGNKNNPYQEGWLNKYENAWDLLGLNK